MGTLGLAPIASAECSETGWAVEPTAASQHLACLINESRVRSGDLPVGWDARLEIAAARHARDMVRRRYFSHRTLAGRGLLQRVQATWFLRGADSWELGEVLAWGTGELAQPYRVLGGFLASPRHRRVVLDGRYRRFGIGVSAGAPRQVDGAATGLTYAVVLGTRRAR